MKITFIRPSMMGGRSRDAMEPLAFAILSALTPPRFERALYDERIETIPLDEPTDLAAITVETYTARRAYQIAAQYRARGVPVVMGGYHPTFLPDEAGAMADAVVVGDAEGVWPRLLADLAAGRLGRRYQSEGFLPLGGVMPDRSIFAGKPYMPAALIQYGRGCRYACEFCSIRAFYGSNLRQRPVDEVVAEIAATGRNYIFLVDDNIFIDLPKARELFRALIPLGIRWSCQVSIDIAQDEALLRLMARSGCTTAVVGLESLNPYNLRQMRKGWNLKHGTYRTAVQRLRDHGIMVYGSFVFGYDGDTVDSFGATVDFALQERLFVANFNPLTPMPGSALYARLRREERLLYERWWLDPTYRYGTAAFQPRGMSPAELTRSCFEARRKFHSWRSILQRGLDRRCNGRTPFHFGLHVAANAVARREILAKQGNPLGAPAGDDPDIAERILRPANLPEHDADPGSLPRAGSRALGAAAP